MTDTLRGVLFIRNQRLLGSILKEDNEYANRKATLLELLNYVADILNKYPS